MTICTASCPGRLASERRGMSDPVYFVVLVVAAIVLGVWAQRDLNPKK